ECRQLMTLTAGALVPLGEDASNTLAGTTAFVGEDVYAAAENNRNFQVLSVRHSSTGITEQIRSSSFRFWQITDGGGGTAYFAEGGDTGTGFSLFKSNGTAAGTPIVKTFSGSPAL